MHVYDTLAHTGISIHAPRMGSDIIWSFSIMSPCIFNSRSPYGERHLRTPLSGGRLLFQFSFPVWGATTNTRILQILFAISILVPRMGSDGGAIVRIYIPFRIFGFNSRSPYGKRSFALGAFYRPNSFNSRSPHGERFVRCFARIAT